jgi:putative oxidoreductase
MDKIPQLLARALLGALFIVFGWQKLAAPAGFVDYAAAFGMPLPTAAVLAAAALELGAGIALVLGWRLAVSAGALAAFSLVTAAIFHADLGNEGEAIQFFKNLAIAGGLAHVAIADWLQRRHPKIDVPAVA